jgi:hypothetical protein
MCYSAILRRVCLSPMPPVAENIERDVMTVYITKYALTSGIIEVEYPEPLPDGGFLRVKLPKADYVQSFGAREWHTTKEAAKQACESLRDLKLASLEKQIAQLKKLTF